LLGGGTVTKPLIVEVESASQLAMKKIEAVGGKVILTSK
jgi:ribosomal protein L15